MAEKARIRLLVSRPIVANAPQADPLSLVIMRPAGATMRVLLRIVAGFSLVPVLFTVLLLVRLWQGGGVAWVLSANTVVQTSIVSWIVTVCLGPIAVSQLWRLRPLGPISGAVLWGNIALYQLWLLWFHTQRTLFPPELLLFGFCTVFLVVLLSPSARRVCSSGDSATRSAVASEEIRQPTEFDGYAGFWRRFAAGLIDVVVAALIAVLLGVISGSAFAFMSGFVIVFLRWGNITEEGLAQISAHVGAVIGIGACIVYYVVMESSASQATLGKMALGVKVTDLYGRRISFGRALGRIASKIVSFLILCIGFIMAAFTEKQQGLHDMIARTLVMKVR
jgi:uncharacterized RDD family membrane protein YckC